MRILHLSADYPDPLEARKTRAVANLLELVPEHSHRVVSLNRVGRGLADRAGWQGGVAALDFADAAGAAHRAVAYGAPPRGLRLRHHLERLADWIAADAAAAGFRPDLVHAHKLSVEGIAGLTLAQRFGVPLAVSVQGNTDLKILRARRDLAPLYRRIWREAAVVFPFAPWAAEALAARLGPRAGPVSPLPCPGPSDMVLAPEVRAADAAPVIRTAFHLRDLANKNALRLIAAVERIAPDFPGLSLEIMGGGDPAAFAALAARAEAAPKGLVRLLGPVAHDRVQALFHTATAFALVSHRESFGMVFAEALLAGCPCLYPRDRAIGGYFEEGGVVLSADPGDEGEIAAALARLIREEADFKARLAALGQSGGLAFLGRAAIAATYRAGLAAAVPGGVTAKA